MRTVFFLVAAALTAACSDSTNAAPGETGNAGAVATGSGGASDTSSATGGSGAGGTPATTTTEPGPDCADGPGYATEVTPQIVDSLDATVVDLNGDPVPEIAAMACGLDICNKAVTDQNGHVLITSPEGQNSLEKPAFKYGDGISYVKFAQPLDPSVSEFHFPNSVTAKLPSAASSPALEAGKSATSGGLTLELAAGSGIEFDLLTYQNPEDQTFRAVQIPKEKAPEAVDASLHFEVIYGAAPVDTVFCPPAKATVANNGAFAAGTEVEFFIHGENAFEEWAPYGGWQKVSDGIVSADGATISTVDAGGLPVLGVIGIRAK